MIYTEWQGLLSDLIANGAEHFKPQRHFGFVITVKRSAEHYVELCVLEITSVGVDANVITTAPYCDAYLKWDSCMHVYFKELGEDGSGYLHMCGVETWIAHVELMRRLYHKAFEVMGRAPNDGEEWPRDSRPPS